MPPALRCCVLYFLAAAATFHAHADEAAKKLAPEQLRLEIMALRTLHQFHFDAGQRAALRKLVTGGSPKAPAADKLNDKVIAKLQELHAAFLKGSEDRIGDAEEDLENLLAKDKKAWEINIEITEAARRQVPAVRRLLSARQVALFLHLYEEDIPDPLTEMLQALEHAPAVKPAEWKTFAASTAELVGRLLAGLDPEKIQKQAARTSRWLEQAKGLTEKELRDRRPALEQEARSLVAGTDPIAVLANIVDHTLADLLSNPRLLSALDALDKTR